MRLTTFSDYSLRVLIYLGLRPGALATVNELAEHYGISRNHLTKVVHYLGQQGYIETLRGKGGGFRLLRAPEELNLGTLVRDSERNSQLVECFDPQGCDCRILPACTLKGILAEAQDAFYQSLARYSLADLLGPRQRLQQLLHISD